MKVGSCIDRDAFMWWSITSAIVFLTLRMWWRENAKCLVHRMKIGTCRISKNNFVDGVEVVASFHLSREVLRLLAERVVTHPTLFPILSPGQGFCVNSYALRQGETIPFGWPALTQKSGKEQNSQTGWQQGYNF